MPLARLENFLKNLNGNTLYVDPNELDSTDSIENRGNSRLRPFKTIQRALLEAASFSYVAGSNNDLFDQTTILIAPGTHYIDNRPGYYELNNNLYDINNSPKSIVEFNVLSNFDITDPNNELYVYNSVDGGVILPKGTSLVATDLRKTKIRPLFVPDPNSGSISPSAIFKLTGGCYFFGFSLCDGDPLGKVYNTYGTNTVTPNFSHHKLTAFEYADGVNKVIRNGSNTGRTDLEMYYYKVAQGFGQQSGRSIIDGYLNLQPNVDEFRIVGELGSGSIGISSIRSGDGVNATNVITVTTESEHNLSPLTPILISGVGASQGSPTTTEYNGNFIVSQIISPTEFTYLTVQVPTGVKIPDVSGASFNVISDTVSSSSPYVFNCSLKSVYGMNGLHADGSKATGFRSMVTAQFTGISLQKDDRAFVKYKPDTGTYVDQSSFSTGTEFLHQDIDSIYKPDWASFHIKASNDAFIQCVSIFAIGYANQFVASSGGDQSITNSNSNFGQRALYSEGFKPAAFPKDDHGFITHIIPPKDVSPEEQNIDTYQVDPALPNSTSKIYIFGENDVLSPPNSIFRGYSIGGRLNDKLYYVVESTEYEATVSPNYKISKNITSISGTILTLDNVTGIGTGLAVKVTSKNGLLPDGLENGKTYFVRVDSGNNVKLYENLVNCNSDLAPLEINNNIGVTSNNLYLESKVSEITSGNVGSPIQWDDTRKNWYISVNTTQSFVGNLAEGPTLYMKRVLDTRNNDDKIYRLRYVVPKDSTEAAVPSTGFVIQKSSRPLNKSYTTRSSLELSPADDQVSSIRNKNAIIDSFYSTGTATIVTKNPHGLKQGNKISIYNLESTNEPNPVGLGTGTGYNGTFTVSSTPTDTTFTYTLDRNPGTIVEGPSSTPSWYSSVISAYKAPPYTIYDSKRSDLPYFTCDQVDNHHQIFSIKEIQKYSKGSTDGVYHISLDSFKNTPISSPFNTSDFKFGQNLDNFYPVEDLDNLNVDPDHTISIASRKLIGKVEVNDPYLSVTKESLIQYLKDFNLGKTITNFSKNGDSITVTTSENHGLGGITRVTIDVAGSGYVDGYYYDIPLFGGSSGSGATVNVEVTGGVPVSFEIANPGSGYTVSDVLSVRGIPGSTNSTTVIINSVNFNSGNSDLIQILGATNSANNGAFVITAVTENTIVFTNPSGVNESSTSAVLLMSGIGYPVSSLSYDSSTNSTDIVTSTPHTFAVGNKVVFDDNSTTYTVISSPNPTEFSISGQVLSASRVYSIGLIPVLKDTNSFNENINTRNFAVYGGYKSKVGNQILKSDPTFTIIDIQGLNKGDIIQVENEIMLVARITGGTVSVKRALFGTQLSDHPDQSAVKTINVLPVELRRPSILRASGHTFEYVGFGPGNYSTGMPSNQTKVLTDDEVSVTQSLSNRGGSVFSSGMNSNGEFFIGKRKWNSSTGREIQVFSSGGNTIINGGGGAPIEIPTNFDELTVNKLIVNNELNASTAEVKGKEFVGAGVAPIGTVMMWSGRARTIPQNWMLCDGRYISKTTYSKLYSIFINNVAGANPHGPDVGDTFRLPDLRERFAVGGGGPNTTNVVDGGQNDGGYSVGELGGSANAVVVQHSHGITDTGHTHQIQSPDNSGALGGQNRDFVIGAGIPVGNTDSATTGITINNQGVSGTDKNLPPYYALLYIIRVS